MEQLSSNTFPSLPHAALTTTSQSRIAKQQVELLQHQLREAAAARSAAEGQLAKLRKEVATQAHRKQQARDARVADGLCWTGLGWAG